MRWQTLPIGGFTGIDWSAANATDGVDPYLVWADITQLADDAAEKRTALWIAIELERGVSVDQLRKAAPGMLDITPVYLAPAFSQLRFCTAQAKPAFFQAVQPGGTLRPLVKRVELGLAVASHDAPPSDKPPATDAQRPPRPPREKPSDKVVGLIDDGVALAHANFLHKGYPRMVRFWRQDDHGRGRVPAEFGYGHELTAADVAKAMAAHRYAGLVDESAVYTALGLSTLGHEWPKGRVQYHGLDLSVSHGTHVLDLAAGPRKAKAQIANVPPDYSAPPSWERAGDAAGECDIMAVQLDYQTVKDTSGGSLNVRVLDGLAYILSRCTAWQQVVVNISFGALAGPHDGSSLLEAAMEQLLELYRGRLKIVLAAGNSYQLRTHANTCVAKKEQAWHWRVHPADRTPSFVELWFQEDRQGVSLQVTSPAGAVSPVVAFGNSQVLVDDGGQVVAAAIYPRRVACGEHGTCALVAVAPTFSFHDGEAVAPSGVWKLVMANGADPAVVDGYVERDDVVIGTRSGARQSHFEDDPALDWRDQYDMQAKVDDPKRPTPIRRSGNFNTYATGRGTISAGGQRVADNSWAFYSPQLPDPDAERSERARVVKVPDAWACSDESAAWPGLKAAGTRSGAVVRMEGTSAASPQVARKQV